MGSRFATFDGAPMWCIDSATNLIRTSWVFPKRCRGGLVLYAEGSVVFLTGQTREVSEGLHPVQP